MNEDQGTFPEKLFVFFKHVDEKGRTLYTGVENKLDGDIRYIRADIAKEREEKLIIEAYKIGFDDGLSLIMEKHNAKDLPTTAHELAYKNSGLEEFK